MQQRFLHQFCHTILGRFSRTCGGERCPPSILVDFKAGVYKLANGVMIVEPLMEDTS